MRDPAGGTSLAVGLLVLGGVQILNIGLAVELGVIAAVGGVVGLPGASSWGTTDTGWSTRAPSRPRRQRWP